MVARSVYAERGWHGFTLDEVARRAGIGKGSLYLRWPGKAALLVAAIRARTGFIAEIDTGALRSDLLEFATGWYDYLLSDEGTLLFRIRMDARFAPELREELARDPYPDYIRATRAIVRRGIDRGELPQDASVTMIADLVAGAVSNHARTMPEHLAQRAEVDNEAYLTALVDTVLTGVSGRG